MMKDFWHTNQHLKIREARRNHWEADMFRIHLPNSMKEAVLEALKPRLEAWANVTNLVPTSSKLLVTNVGR
jgi:hypothetical protein